MAIFGEKILENALAVGPFFGSTGSVGSAGPLCVRASGAASGSAVLGAVGGSLGATLGCSAAGLVKCGWKTIGKPWENHRRTIGKWWFNGGLMVFQWDLPSGNLT